MDIGFQIKYRAWLKRVVPWVIAQSMGGSGLLMSRTLRHFYAEYVNRLNRYGPDSMPSSYSVVHAFTFFSDELFQFGLRPEREHLLHSDDYFRWYAANTLIHVPSILIDAMHEGVTYSYDMANDSGGYRITLKRRVLIVAGVSLIRHGHELSCILVAGENPARPSDKEAQAMDAADGSYFGREQIAADSASSEYDVDDRYLEGSPEFCRVIVLMQFDLKANKYGTRYVNVDLGKSYSVYTDDPDVPRDVKAKGVVLKNLEEYQPLVSALATLIYLPITFADESAHVNEQSFRTDFSTKTNDAAIKNAIEILKTDEYWLTRSVKCLATRGDPNEISEQELISPDLESESNGFWRTLGPREIGRDKDGGAIVGRTWVGRTDMWTASKPSKVLLNRPKSPPSGKDPGQIYVARSPAHGPDIYKVGLTRKNAETRAEQLSTTGVPLPFCIITSWDVGDCLKIETECHKRLSKYRLNPNREFFRVNLQYIAKTVTKVIEDVERGEV